MVMKKSKSKKDLKYYLNLPWTYTIQTTYETGVKLYVVHVNELPYVATHASSFNEAMKQIKEAMQAVFEIALENEDPIPEPVSTELESITYHPSRKRYSMLTKEAEKRSYSLNQILDYAIDKALSSKSLRSK
jgi:antitoxin HicB